jgi:hypothetical protein
VTYDSAADEPRVNKLADPLSRHRIIIRDQ